MARGFSQVEGIDYDETFAPVARYTSIQMIMAIAVEMGWRIHQMDVKTAFLNGILEEEVYIEQLQGFQVSARDTYVCRLRKALYGLKQAPRAWYSRIDTYLQDLGFEKSEADPNLYYLTTFHYSSEEARWEMQGRPCYRVQDEGHRHDALLFGYGSLAGGWESFPRIGEVCR